MHDALSNQSAEKVEEYLALYEELNSFVPEYDAESGIDMDEVYDGMKNQTYANDAAVIEKYNELCIKNLPPFSIKLNVYRNDVLVGEQKYDEGKFKAEIEFTNNQDDIDENFIVIAALFNEADDSIAEVASGKGTALRGRNKGTAFAEFNIASKENTYMKVYIWNSKTLVPYRTPIDLSPV